MSNKSTQWKKGQSGNPKGRTPLIKTFSETARMLMDAQEIDVTWTVNGKTKKLKMKSSKNMHYGIVAALIMEALKGSVVAAREIVDRIDGKATQALTLDHSGEIKSNIQIELPPKDQAAK